MYVKVFDRLLRSSIMAEDIATRWVWVAMLTLANRDGIVYGTRSALARAVNVTIEQFNASLARLLAPDPDSSSDAEEGRRIVEVAPNTWWIVNYSAYREMRDNDAERAATRERVRLHRQRKAAETKGCNATVTPCNASNAIGEADTDTEADAEIAPPRAQAPAREGVEAGNRKGHGKAAERAAELATSVADLATYWNDHVATPWGKKKVLKPDACAKKIAERLAADPDLAYWHAVMDRIAKSKKLRDGFDTWPGATFSWVFASNGERIPNHARVMEGAFDDPPERAPESYRDRRKAAEEAELERIHREAWPNGEPEHHPDDPPEPNDDLPDDLPPGVPA